MDHLCMLIGFVVFVYLSYFFRKWLQGGVCRSAQRLEGKTVIVTGANSGIGKETAIDLAGRGATVIFACRNMDRGAIALEEVKQKSKSDNVFLKLLDLSSLNSVRAFVASVQDEHSELHILVNNAGVGGCAYTKTEDGFELHLGVNHLGHFALTNLLLPLMVKSAPSRIINVSSKDSQLPMADINFNDINSEKSYSRFKAYFQSKLANVLFTKELARKTAGTGVATFVVHPGVVLTEMIRHSNQVVQCIIKLVGPLLMKTPYQGAQTSIYCAVEGKIEDQSGMYFADCAVRKTNAKSVDEGLAKKLWEVSEQMTGVKFPL